MEKTWLELRRITHQPKLPPGEPTFPSFPYKVDTLNSAKLIVLREN